MAEKRINRRLAAVLAADVVGYSRLMGADEVGTLAALKRYREIAFDPAVASHHGRIVNRIDVCFQDGGSINVKNIDRPIRIWTWHPDDPIAGPSKASSPNPNVTKASIAVLPFDNMSGDREQEYFSDGISEDIITDLSKISALDIISRNTAFTFKNKPVDVRQVAAQLRVSHVLEGSVRKAAGRVRITAQLIDGSNDSHLWAERYDRDLNDIFALQDEISRAIVDALKVKLLPEEKKAIER